MIRAVVAEDAFLVRAGVVAVLEAAGLEVVGQAGDIDELLEQVRAHRPDVVVTDIRMPPTNTDEGLRAAEAIRSQTRVVVLSQHVNEGYALRLLEDGADGVGYLLKQRVLEPERFVGAVLEVARGGTALDPEVVAQMLERRSPIEALTPTEREVLARVAEGQSNRAIAEALGCSLRTLDRHLTAVFEKLGLPPSAEVHRRVLAVLAYLREEQ
jgi:DNA-binding NarL/FixJ family response regulator